MTTTKNNKTTAPLAHRVPTAVSATIQEYTAWLEGQTGVKIDALSVYLGSQLRGTWQKSAERQAELADAAAARVLADAAKAKAKAAREAAAVAKTAEPKDKPVAKAAPKAAPKKVAPKRPTKAGSTIAATGNDGQPVVIAETNHVDAVQA
ncbi:hypothetical protein QMG83_08990 [Salinibacterium sp. G-O1]|uniref:hypothetical protein n=1 Tax=Salinibacterium sp. G-O1 TaxID=3046208 RepID=UPI0024B91754|nr:hypothetical protein [Salinibacterium sp. G-O1]MDJ0335357.1 hypothetical protein [Salinibacterium sp. G-O1]